MSRGIVALSGATGLVGSHVVQALTREGYEVWSLVRKKRKSANGTEIFYDYEHQNIDEKALKHCDAVVHLAGKNIMSGFWSTSFKREIWDSRIFSTRLIAGAMAKLFEEGGPRVLICASAIGFYGDGKSEELDENSPRGKGFLAELCEAWEEETRVAKNAGVRVVNARFGTVLKRDDGMLKALEKLASMGLLPVIGSGKQYMAVIGINDLVNALLFALQEDKITGPLNIVCPQPITNQVFIKSLTKVFGRNPMFRIPAWILNFFGDQSKIMLDSCRAIPAKLIHAGFIFSELNAKNVIRQIYQQNTKS